MEWTTKCKYGFPLNLNEQERPQKKKIELVSNADLYFKSMEEQVMSIS